MDLNEKTLIPMVEGSPLEVPPLALIGQKFPDDELTDLPSEIAKGLAMISQDLREKRIAITVGSLGICRIAEIVQEVINRLKARGAKPFIVPAMGSHGGATAAGQRELIAGYGITEETMGVPVLDSMETVELGKIPDSEVPVFCQKDAYEADGIIVMNKIKPHADFKSDIESGLCKMMVIGLGKHRGATEIHRRGFARMGELLEPCARLFLQKAPVILGIGILENAYDRLMRLDFVLPNDLIESEKNLLRIAKDNIARLLMPRIDVLIIQQIGKDISGEGMDPNVTGRPGSELYEGFEAPEIRKIIVFEMSEKTHGNGVGIGMADITTAEFVENLDLTQVYTNAITSTLIGPARLPLIAPTQKLALDFALRTCNSEGEPRVVWIPDTLHLDRIYVSPAVLEDLKDNECVTALAAPEPVKWDENDKMIRPDLR